MNIASPCYAYIHCNLSVTVDETETALRVYAPAQHFMPCYGSTSSDLKIDGGLSAFRFHCKCLTPDLFQRQIRIAQLKELPDIVTLQLPAFQPQPHGVGFKKMFGFQPGQTGMWIQLAGLVGQNAHP